MIDYASGLRPGRAQEWTAALTAGARPSRASSRIGVSAWSTAPSSCNCTVPGRTRWSRRDERLRTPGGAEPDPPSAGALPVGELHRLRGDFAEAERLSAGRASSVGDRSLGSRCSDWCREDRMPPRRSIRRAVDEHGRVSRPRLLGPLRRDHAGRRRVGGAHWRAEELTQIAESLARRCRAAMAAQADGAVLLGEGDPHAALASLRHAWTAWQGWTCPTRRRGPACSSRSPAARSTTTTGPAIEFDAARDVFERARGVARARSRVDGCSTRPAPSAGGLTAREIQVLRLVAAGKTNRAVAARLVISEKTVERHLSNIFDEVGCVVAGGGHGLRVRARPHRAACIERPIPPTAKDGSFGRCADAAQRRTVIPISSKRG